MPGQVVIVVVMGVAGSGKTVDGSFFCSSGAVNPGLTIMANALRVGEHILQPLG